MAKEVMKAFGREELGTSSAKKVRAKGMVPAVVYIPGEESKNIALEAGPIAKFVAHHGAGGKAILEIDGQEEMVIIKNLQRAVVKDDILHIEFLQLKSGEKITFALPIHFIGEESISRDFVLQKAVHELEVEVLPKDLVDNIEVDLTELKIGTAFTIADIDKSKYEGIEFIGEDDMVIASLSEATKFEEPSDEDEEAIVYESAEETSEEE